MKNSAKPISSKSKPAELKAFFNSRACRDAKAQICDLGRRMWQRAYVEGNGGNMAVRVGTDLAVCTPTMISKGFMTPEDLCLVDLDGNQLLGKRKRTSEILMHLQMMKRQPRAVATCHAHPPHATAFALIGELPPVKKLPEFEVFCALGIAPYRTPSSPEMGRLVADLTGHCNTILMTSHGVVTWSGKHLEEAYWRMEILESYCRTLIAARQIGKQTKTFSQAQMVDLMKLKKSFGL
ncbi:MAG TPA: class II aldolase/adducin family protein [Candidatus Binatia bacterium]|nr:class II aldolase/adducin family protein [Candidatus Binatia bacterium]